MVQYTLSFKDSLINFIFKLPSFTIMFEVFLVMSAYECNTLYVQRYEATLFHIDNNMGK